MNYYYTLPGLPLKEDAMEQNQQLFAKIKESSKYADQIYYAKRGGEYPFPVYIVTTTTNNKHCVIGGPGQSYRLADVDLFVMDHGKEIKIS